MERGPWRVVVIAGWVVGALIAVLPMLAIPVMTDARYHYPLALLRYDGPWDLLVWTVHDTEWRVTLGRIAPLGVLVQHLIYAAGARLAVASGLSFSAIDALVRLMLIGLSGLGWWYLVRVLLPRLSSASSLLMMSFSLLLINVTTPQRSGWTTFSPLTIGAAIAFFFTAGFAARVAQGRHGRWGAWVLGLLGVALPLGYEMYYAGGFLVVAAVMAAAPAGRRVRTAAVFVVPFVMTIVAVRIAVAMLTVSHSYEGLQPNPGPVMIRDTATQLVTAVWPGFSPSVLGVLGALLLVGSALLLTSERGAAAHAAATAQPPAAERRTALWLVGGLLVTALATSAIMSLSVQAQDIVAFGVPYRPAPVLTFMLVGAGVVAMCTLLRSRALVVAAVVLAVAGGVGWGPRAVPFASEQAQSIEALQAQVVRGDLDAVQRCALVESAIGGGKSGYTRKTVDAQIIAFEERWGEPLCPGQSVDPQRARQILQPPPLRRD